nr:unnamed protein product [Callosobruchus analis]
MTDDEKKWHLGLARIKFGILVNSTVNKTTGKSPHELMFGYRPRGANDSFLAVEVGNPECSDTLYDRREQAKKCIDAYQGKQKQRYDSKRLGGVKYKVGQ